MKVNCTLAVVFLTLSALSVPAAYGKDELIVGVRQDAKPFSYRNINEEVANSFDEFSGYVVEICRQTFDDLRKIVPELSLRTVTTTAFQREQMLETGQIDVLCDPASIASERSSWGVPSTPIFLTGIGFAAAEPFPRTAYCGAIVGIVTGTTSNLRSLQRILNGNEMVRFKTVLEGAIDGKKEASIKSEECLRLGTEISPPAIKRYQTHDVAVKDFCEGKFLYYVGDIDIIAAKIKEYGCRARLSTNTFTEERYVIYISTSDSQDSRAALRAKFLSVLQHGILTSNYIGIAFHREFAGYKPSQPLQIFVRTITGVEQGLNKNE